MDENRGLTMRKILFRGKWKNSGEWVYGNLFNPDKADTPTQICIGTYIARTCYEIDPETVGQYTGLTDKNGRKIFEGDIVVFADFFDDKIHRGVVYWCDSAFWFDCTETEGDEGIYSLAYISANILEVIGNIYDNPELLEVKK